MKLRVEWSPSESSSQALNDLLIQLVSRLVPSTDKEAEFFREVMSRVPDYTQSAEAVSSLYHGPKYVKEILGDIKALKCFVKEGHSELRSIDVFHVAQVLVFLNALGLATSALSQDDQSRPVTVPFREGDNELLNGWLNGRKLLMFKLKGQLTPVPEGNAELAQLLVRLFSLPVRMEDDSPYFTEYSDPLDEFFCCYNVWAQTENDMWQPPYDAVMPLELEQLFHETKNSNSQGLHNVFAKLVDLAIWEKKVALKAALEPALLKLSEHESFKKDLRQNSLRRVPEETKAAAERRILLRYVDRALGAKCFAEMWMNWLPDEAKKILSLFTSVDEAQQAYKAAEKAAWIDLRAIVGKCLVAKAIKYHPQLAVLKWDVDLRPPGRGIRLITGTGQEQMNTGAEGLA